MAWPTDWVREGEHANLVPDSGNADGPFVFTGAGIVSTRETSPPVALPAGVSACTKVVHSSGSGSSLYGTIMAPITVVPGETYRLSIYVHCSALVSDALAFGFITRLNGTLVRMTEGVASYATNSDFTRLDFSCTIAAGENQLEFRAWDYPGTTSATWWLAAAMVTKTSGLITYFDGDTNGDSYWLIPSPQLDPALLQVVAFGNLGGGVVLAGTAHTSSGGYIFKSTDYGVTWGAGYRIGTTKNIAAMVPINSTTCIAGGQNGTGTEWWKTTDSGVSWTQMTGVGLNVSAGEYGHCGAVLSDGSIVLGTYGGSASSHIYRSTDGGANWSTVYTSSVQGFFCLTDMGSGTVYAGSGIQTGTCQVHRSTDYGATWSVFQTLGDTSTHVLAIEKLADGSVLLSTGTTGAVWKAANVGAAFALVQQLGSEELVYSVRQLYDDSILAGTMPNGAIYRSTDDGATWTLVLANVAGAATIHDICELSTGADHNGWILAATDNSSRVGRSTDYGLTWSGTSTTPSESRQYLAHESGGVLHIADDAHAHLTTIRGPMVDVIAGQRYGFRCIFGIDAFAATLCEVSIGWYSELGWWLSSDVIVNPSATEAESARYLLATAPANAARARLYVSWNGTTGTSHATLSEFHSGMLVDTNPFFDGTAEVKIGTLNVTAALLPGLSFSTTNPGGFGEATMRLPASSPWGTYHAQVVKGAAVTIKHNTTQTLFEGVVTNDCTHATIEGGTAFYDVTAAGKWWVAGQRKDFCCVFTDDSLEPWFLSPQAHVPPMTADNDGRLYLALQKKTNCEAGKASSWYYWLHNGLGDANEDIRAFVASLDYYVVDGPSTTTWQWDISTSTTDPWGTWTVQQTWSNSSSSSGFALIVCPSGTQAVRVRLYPATTDIDDSNIMTTTRYTKLTELCVVAGNSCGVWTDCTQTTADPTTITTKAGGVAVDHGLVSGDRVAICRQTGTGPHGWYTVATAPTSSTFTVAAAGTAGDLAKVARGVRLDTALGDILGGDTALTTGLAATVDEPGIGALHYGLAIRPHTDRASAGDSVALLHSAPLDYGFWESAALHIAARATPDAANDYLVDATTPGIDYSVFAATEESPGYVKVLYRTRDVLGNLPAGTQCAVYRPSLPTWAGAASVVELWDEFADASMTEAQAQDLGDQILDWIADNVYTGTITIATPTVPKRAGGTKNTCYVRAGDYIADTNHDATTGRMLITSTSFDADSGVLTVGIGETRRDFTGRLASWLGPKPSSHHTT